MLSSGLASMTVVGVPGLIEVFGVAQIGLVVGWKKAFVGLRPSFSAHVR